jgi:cyclic-di-GMP-binding protein
MRTEPSLAPAAMAIPDLMSGLQILARLPLTNPPQAEREINRVLDSLLQAPPPAADYLSLLEQCRVPLAFVEEERARGYVDNALPLPDVEEAAFQQVVATWRKIARAYAHCAQLDRAVDDPQHARRVAQILHRCIHYSGMAIVEHQRVRRELPAGLWLDVHGYYASAEEWGVATLPIPDALDPLGRSAHCTAAFVSLLLTELAGPCGLTARDQRLVRRWAKLWSPLVTLHAAVPGEPLPPCVIDLMQDVALRATADCLQTEQLRRLDTSRLAMQMNQVGLQLSQKIPPAQIGLGEDCTAGQCHRLLEHLSRPWLQVRALRKFRRHATSGIAQVCAGFAAMHYFIAGREFTQPENAHAYSRQEFDRLFTFRHMVDPTQPLQLRREDLGRAVDEWEVINQSANGFRLMRSVVGKKMTHGQLLAIRPHDGEHYLLAQTIWLMQERGGGLVAGIAALPGLPAAIAARRLARPGERAEPYSPAFLLPANPAIGTEPSLIVPPGWFHSGRRIEVFTDGSWQVKLLHVLGDGPDFEQVSFVVG